MWHIKRRKCPMHREMREKMESANHFYFRWVSFDVVFLQLAIAVSTHIQCVIDLLYFTLKLYAFDTTSYNTKEIINEEADNWLCGQRDLLVGCTLSTPLFSLPLFLSLSPNFILLGSVGISILMCWSIEPYSYKWKYHTAFRLIIFIIL